MLEISGAVICESLGIPVTKGLEKRRYVLAKINLVRAACPQGLRQTRLNGVPGFPIVVERNRYKLGFVEATGYMPAAVITAGAARRDAMVQQGEVRGWVWMEKGAIDASGAQILGAPELFSKLEEGLRLRFGAGAEREYVHGQHYPLIEAVYPFERQMVYQLNGKRYGQTFAITSDEYKVHLQGGAVAIEATGSCNKDAMMRVQTGVRYAYAPPMGNSQSTTTGAKNSELVTQIVRNMDNIMQAVNAYLAAVKNGMYKPMKPSFAPVNLSDAGKILASIVKAGIAPLDFVRWACMVQEAKQAKRRKVA